MTTMNGNFVLYSMLHAYNIFDMNVTGLTLLGVSITYTTTVGREDACEEDQIIKWSLGESGE